MFDLHWNYRVVERDEYFGIYEVYYDEDGEISTWTVAAVEPRGETVAELKEDLMHMQQALDAPVLKWDETTGDLIEAV